MRVLELGCGPKKTPGAIGVDINPRSQADIIVNLNSLPFPFSSNQFDRVICNHVLEHLDNVVGVMEEIHRVARPHAIISIQVPHFSSVWYYQDPTHRHTFATRTFEYWDPDTQYHFFGLYSPPSVRLKKRSVEIIVAGTNPFARLLHWFINKYPTTYEERFAFLLPRHAIHAKLEVIK